MIHSKGIKCFLCVVPMITLCCILYNKTVVLCKVSENNTSTLLKIIFQFSNICTWGLTNEVMDFETINLFRQKINKVRQSFLLGDKSCPVSIQPLFASLSGSNDSSTNFSKYDFSFPLRDTFRNGVAYSAWNLYLTQLLTLNPGRLCVVTALSQQVEAWRSGGIHMVAA